ncbi:hypothetical protein PMKS-000898 [Pichia membranifaciens]|uniref:Uncharacterized protein n=1 Tax=Pichia membranifaciens TaxID=4926 RepID=A0A1Q2YD16_9ASCO|nr:hypothetical protein PMKS-000898 [Pichia membranifaciens]
MDVPLAPLYYGLLIILSIFFYNVAEEGSLLEGGEKLYQLLNEKKDLIKENIAETFQPEHFVEEKNSALGSLPIFDYFKKHSYLYDKACFIIDTLTQGALEFLQEHPQLGQNVSKLGSVVHDYCELIYSTCEEKLLYVAGQEPFKTYLSEYVKLHDTFVTPYVEMASDRVGSLVEKVADFIKKQTNEDVPNDEIVYTFLVTVVGVFILKATFTKILGCFAKDAFQMNRSISDMYKQQLVKDMIKDSEQHSDVYLEIKEDTLTDYNMTVDDLQEIEKEYEAQNASNRRQTRNENQEQEQGSKASNRTRNEEESNSGSKNSSEFKSEAEVKTDSGSNLKNESEEKGRQRPEEIKETEEIEEIEAGEVDEVDEAEEVAEFLARGGLEPVATEEVDEVEEVTSFSASPVVTSKSSKTVKGYYTDGSESTDSSIANTTYTTTTINTTNSANISHNVGTRLVYVSSNSIVYDENDALLKENPSGLSSNAVSGVTLAVDDAIQKAAARSSSSSAGGEDGLCESVRSLLV